MSADPPDPTELAQIFASGRGFQLLVQHLPDAILVLRSDGTVVYASALAATYFGRALGEIIGRPFVELVSEEDRSVFPPAPYADLVGSWDFRPHGEGVADRWLNAAVLTPTFGGEPPTLREVVGDAVLLFVRDLHGREEGVRDRIDLYRRTIDAMDNLIVVTDPTAEDNPIVLANEEFLAFTGYARDEVIGHNCRFLQTRADGTRDDDQTGVRELALAVTRSEPASVVLRNYKKDGTLFYNELFVTPLRRPDGRVVNFVGVQNDVTERVQAEADLRAREAILHEAVELSERGIFITDAQGPDSVIVYTNAAFSAITGYASDAAVGRPPWFWWGEGQDRVRSEDFFGTVFASGSSYAVAQCRRENGDAYWAELHMTAGGESSAAGLVGTLSDVSARVDAEQGERRYNEELQALSARLVEVQESERQELARELHDEIGQVLTSLLLSLDAAAELPHRAQDILDGARDTVRELQDRVRNLSLDLRPSLLDDFGLGPALAWLFDRVRDKLHLTVHAHVPEALPALPPDTATAAYRIIQEALTNVAKHAATPEATVRVRVEDDTLHLAVSDAGQGVDLETVESDQTGLRGMSERARGLGGSLHVASRPGEGMTVSARLPVA